MTNINPLRFGVTGNQYLKQETQDDVNNSAGKENQSAQSSQKQMDSNEVLGYMAAQNADIIPVKTQKTLDVSQYVTSEQEARIEEFIEGFESDYNEAYDIAANEFPEISQQAASDIALAYINASY